MRDLWEEYSFVLRFYPLESALTFLLGGLAFAFLILVAVFVPLEWFQRLP